MHELDLAILHFFNQTLASCTLDWATSIITNVRYWYPIYVIAVLFLIYQYKWRGVRMLIVALLLIAATDSLAHYIIKPLVDRPRPCADAPNGQHVVSWIRLPDGARWDESFPSSHALNNFAIAAFFVTLFPKKRSVRWLYVVALIISVSRIYEGVHYPSDVASGALIGAFLGLGFASLFIYFEKKPNNTIVAS